jgi:hypothetical protein
MPQTLQLDLSTTKDKQIDLLRRKLSRRYARELRTPTAIEFCEGQAIRQDVVYGVHAPDSPYCSECSECSFSPED